MADVKKEEQNGKLSIRKKRIMTYFIEATEKLIHEEGIDGLSIRKIATEAGYNSATLYNYFQDLEHLVLFASVRHLRAYAEELRKQTQRDMTSIEIYRTIYRVFSEYSFRSPDIFYNVFFGRYSDRLRDVLKQYYELFPDELGDHKSLVKSMLSQWNIYERDHAVMAALVEEGFVKEERRDMTIQLIVRTHQSFMLDASALGEHIDVEKHVEDFMKLFDYIMEAAM